VDNLSQILNLKLGGIIEGLSFLTPEFFLIFLIVLILVLDLFLKSPKGKQTVFIVTIAGFFGYVALLFRLKWMLDGETLYLYSHSIKVSTFNIIFKLIFALAAFITLIFSSLSVFFKQEKENRIEYVAIVLSSLLGLNFMVMSTSLLMLYLSMEFVSIVSYILTVYAFTSKSREGALKYYLYGVFASAVMLYGISLLYGFSGIVNFEHPDFLSGLMQGGGWLPLVGFWMLLAGFLFKIAAFPFHVWAPDVYEGAPTPISAFFSIAPKAAGMVVLIHFLISVQHLEFDQFLLSLAWKKILLVIAMLTIAAGNFAALFQNNLKRLLAYSSIAHSGLLLGAIVAFNDLGISSLVFYIVVYLFMNFGAFLMVEILSGLTGSEDVSKYKGIGNKIPFTGAIFVIILIALAGLPPTAGFTAKFLLFSSFWKAYLVNNDSLMLLFLLFAVLNTVISLFYYLKIPYYMYFKKGDNLEAIEVGKREVVLLIALVLPLLVLFFKPEWLLNYIESIKLFSR
jgi:NADH-quinone oxidoreductase subunit N